MTASENEHQAQNDASAQNHLPAFNHGAKINFDATPNPAAVAQLEVTPELIASIAAATKVEHAPRTLGEVELAGMGDEELASLAEGCRQRANTYALLARVYRVEVDDEFLQRLQAARYAAKTGNDEVDRGYRMVVQALSGTWEHTLLELAKDYVRAFIGFNGDHASAAYPYESVYLSEKHLLMQNQRDEVLACFRAAGLEKDGDWREPEDHVALEFEYMQTLAQRCADALDAGDADLAQDLLRDQSHFLQDHLNAWVPAFTHDVERYATLDFYRGFACVTRGWLACEMELFGELGGTVEPEPEPESAVAVA